MHETIRKKTSMCHAAFVFLIVAVPVLILVLPALTWANDKAGKNWHVCVTKIVSHPALDACEKGFEAGLASAGFKKDVNVFFDNHNAEGEPSRADTISQLFAQTDCDLIHSITTPSTQSVLKFVNKTPVVFSAVTDPESAGIVPAGSVPGSKTGTQITGVSDKWPVVLQMRAYSRFVPQAGTWGTIYNPAEDNSVSHVAEMRKAMKALDLKLIEVHAANAAEVEAAARSLVGQVQAIAITADNTSVANFEVIAGICNENRIALFAGDVDSVSKGAIAAYGPDYYLIGYAAGKKAALVLKGVKPGDIPWGPMEKYSLVINQRAAALQGVVIEPDLLRIADKVVD
jgi:putative tryptophan/tyrosine transport system substrate-binding protein